ncbi:MAG TPA: amidohydrolase family protein, partial [Tepidisphaeraceae bacterium]
MIVARGRVEALAGDESIDCGGAVVLPGMVNGHTHLYSALAVGMPAAPRVPRNFLEILQLVWWRLDRALDEGSNEMSATVGALEALRCGTTTLIDHHASPAAIEGSLDAMERGIARVGLRGVLCYEVTDRNGREGREKGLEENRRYLRKRGHGRDAHATGGRFAGLVGAHASFTLEDESLDGLAAMAKEFGVGVHIHVAEDPCDEEHSLREHNEPLVNRLERHGIVNDKTIFGHGTHLSDDGIARINASNVRLAHNPRSNMNNAVGYTRVGKITCPIQLGTDGIGADMFTEAKTAWFKSRDGGAGISPSRVIGMLAQSARTASQCLGVTVGKLEVGAAADVVVTDYVPFTEMTAENFPGHFIFAMGPQNVRDVIVGGKVALRDRRVVSFDEVGIRSKAVEVANALWERMGRVAE